MLNLGGHSKHSEWIGNAKLWNQPRRWKSHEQIRRGKSSKAKISFTSLPPRIGKVPHLLYFALAIAGDVSPLEIQSRTAATFPFLASLNVAGAHRICSADCARSPFFRLNLDARSSCRRQPLAIRRAWCTFECVPRGRRIDEGRGCELANFVIGDWKSWKSFLILDFNLIRVESLFIQIIIYTNYAPQSHKRYITTIPKCEILFKLKGKHDHFARENKTNIRGSCELKSRKPTLLSRSCSATAI